MQLVYPNQIFAPTHGAAEVHISYLQIYCEMVGDLLNPNMDSALSIREKSGVVFVEGLSKSRVTSAQDVYALLDLGNNNRATASTLMNATSSRSHAALIVTISFPSEEGNDAQAVPSSSVRTNKRESSLVLIDLAGSERSTAAGGHYTRLEEAKAINLSLSALGNCMNALAEGRSHIPYRDSKLTRLLQGSLGGGSRTSVIVNISPGEDEKGEVLNSLKFASRASRVQVVAKVSRCVERIIMMPSNIDSPSPLFSSMC